MVGSLGKLYESVENISDTYMQPNLNKDILLKPKEPGAVPNHLGLLTNVESTERKAIYTCSNKTSVYYNYSNHTHSITHPYFSEDPKAKCPQCGNSLSCKMSYVAPPSSSSAESSAGKAVGFVKPVVTYMIMDDLEVKPMSTISTIALLNQFNVQDFGALEEKVVDLGMNEGVKLLKEALRSKSVLTCVFLQEVSGRVKHEHLNSASLAPGLLAQVMCSHQTATMATASTPKTPTSPVTLQINILVHRTTSKVILATTDSKFIELLYGFMLFPVSALGMVDVGIISSICESFREIEVHHIREGFRKEQIFKPRPTTFPLPDPVLKSCLEFSEDDCRYKATLYQCEKKCLTSYFPRDPKTQCRSCDGLMNEEITLMHAEATRLNDAAGGGYVHPSARFVILDNMEIKAQESFFDVFRLAEEAGFAMSELETVSLSVDESSFFSLIKLCVLSSENILTEFCKNMLIIEDQKASELEVATPKAKGAETERGISGLSDVESVLRCSTKRDI